MASNYVNAPKPFKFLEGWMEYKSGDEKWVKYWCVMSGNSLHIFSNSRPSKNTHVGAIEVGPGSKLVKREGDEKNGYKFDLYSLKKMNRFKTSKFSERELWRAFIEGIANGVVPENIDLLPGQINDIQISLNEYFKIQKLVKRPLPIPSETPSETKLKSGFDTPNGSASGSYPALDESDYYLEPVSPVDKYQQKLIFYTDSKRSDIPSWFFSNCSRELAVQILDRGAKYGNTLMRESTSDSKNLVISKRMESNGGKTETHYIVNRLTTGYKIDVENQHDPMKSLSEVMEFFVETSGKAVTFPMSCNELSKLGINEKIYNHYNTKIVKVLFDADSGEETVDIPSRDKESAPTPCKALRSKSVPDIGQQTGMKMQALNISEELSLNKHSYVNTNQRSLSYDKGKRTIQKNASPSSPVIQPPPLPPNHPPPMKQSASFDSPKEPKRQLPKHSQSLGATDFSNIKQTARLSHPVNENVQVSNERTMIPDMQQINIPAKLTASPSEETSNIKANALCMNHNSDQLTEHNVETYGHVKTFKDLDSQTEQRNANLPVKREVYWNNSDDDMYEKVDLSVDTIPSQRLRRSTKYYKRRFSLRDAEICEPFKYSTCNDLINSSKFKSNYNPVDLPISPHFYLSSIEELPSDTLETYEKLENCLSLASSCKNWNLKDKSNIFHQSDCGKDLENIKELQLDEDYEIIPDETNNSKISSDFSTLISTEDIYSVMDEETDIIYSKVNVSNLCGTESIPSFLISTCSRPVSLYSLNGTYAELTDLSALSSSHNTSDNYIDIIANEEDIRAARAARGSFSGSSTAKTNGIGMKRSKSDLGRIISPEENFKKKLEGLLVGSAPRSSGISSSQSLSQLSSVNNETEVSSYNEHYQNIDIIKTKTDWRK